MASFPVNVIQHPMTQQVEVSASKSCTDQAKAMLYQMCSDGFLTDITVSVADGSPLQAHRAVLAASSAFFNSLFHQQSTDTGSLSKPQQTVTLPFIQSTAMNRCLEVAYIGKTCISNDPTEMDEFLKAATFLQQPEAIAVGENCLINSISKRNIDSIYMLADRYSLVRSMQKLQLYVEGHLVKIARKPSNLKRICHRQMLEILLSDQLVINETQLLEIVTKWLQATDNESNKDIVQSVLRQIRFMLVEQSVLVKVLPIVHALSNGAPGSDETCFKRVYEAFDYITKPHSQPVVNNKQNQLRGRSRITVRVAGKALLPTGEELMQDELVRVSAIDPSSVLIMEEIGQALSHHQAVVVNNFVYIMGGTTTICQRGLSATAAVFRFDPRKDEWWRPPSMLERRAYFAAASIGGCIFVAGGEYRYQSTRTAEAYNPAANTWNYLAPMPDRFSGHAGCAGDDGCFYTLGGWRGDDTSGNICSHVLKYDPANDAWTQLPSMLHDRAFHCCVAVNRRIYVFGGVDHRKRPIIFGEFFDIDTMQWKETESMPSMHNEGSCFLVYNQSSQKPVAICLCGGYDASNKAQTAMALYDLAKNSWSTWQQPTSRYLRFAGSSFVSFEVPAYTERQCDENKQHTNSTNWSPVFPTQANNGSVVGPNRRLVDHENDEIDVDISF